MPNNKFSNPFVIDQGTCSIKYGFAEDNSGQVSPSVVAPSHPAKPTKTLCAGKQVLDDQYLARRCDYFFPLDTGHIVEKFKYQHLIKTILEQEAKICNTPIVLTESACTTAQDRADMTQFMFESMQVPALTMVSSEAASLYSSGRQNGVAIDLGENCVRAVPVSNCVPIASAISVQPVGARAMEQFMVQQLVGYDLDKHMNIVRDIKEKCWFYASLDYEASCNSNAPAKEYELPDGQILELTKLRFQVPELLFNPFIAKLDGIGIHDMAFSSVQKVDSELRSTMFDNMMLCGGCALIDGVRNRFMQDMCNLVPNHVRLGVRNAQDPLFAAWKGTAWMAGLQGLLQYTSKQEYEEVGSL